MPTITHSIVVILPPGSIVFIKYTATPIKAAASPGRITQVIQRNLIPVYLQTKITFRIITTE